MMRHGESESNAANIVQTDIKVENGLTEKGKEQVLAAVEELKQKGITKIISSPFGRTSETAAIVREALGLAEDAVLYDERLQEIQLGEYENQSNDVYQRFVTEHAKWCNCAPVGGESWENVRDRVGAFLYDVELTYKNETILIVSHNSPLRMMAAVAHGSVLADTDFDHDADGMRYDNAEVRQIPFTPMPHNDHFELDFHRPYIDEVVLEEQGVRLERVPDVFDCWFESGSMPYGQHHYPFEHKVAFEKEHFPAQFIAEGLDQTRGWFYSLIVLGTALFGKSPYENVIVNGLVLAEDGKKMSKSLQNYPDPLELANRTGVDAMRFYLLSSSIMRGEDLNFSEKEVLELQRKNIGRLHNVLAMYELCNDQTQAASNSEHILDKWIVSRLNQLVAESTVGYQNYELDKATRPITDFIDDLSVWYLRRSRDRLKGEDEADKQAALATLRHILRTLALTMAPAMPFYAEHLWQAVREENDADSVHLAAWPEEGVVDETVLTEMEIVRAVVSAALEARTKAGIKVRQPIASVSGVVLSDELQLVVLEEINAKVYQISEDETVQIDTTLTPELLAEGDARALARSIQSVRKEQNLLPTDVILLEVTQPTAELLENTKELFDVVKVVNAERVRVNDEVTPLDSKDSNRYGFKVIKK